MICVCVDKTITNTHTIVIVDSLRTHIVRQWTQLVYLSVFIRQIPYKKILTIS